MFIVRGNTLGATPFKMFIVRGNTLGATPFFLDKSRHHTTIMPKVYYIEYKYFQHFFRTFGELAKNIKDRFNIDYTIQMYEQNNENIRQEDHTYVGSFLTTDEDSEIATIIEFDFGHSEIMSFMRCTGPSSECCFIVKKTRAEFWDESMSYMTESMKNLDDDDCHISVEPWVHWVQNDCECIVVTMVDDDGNNTDLMQFEYIQLL